MWKLKAVSTSSFICQGASTRRQRRDLFGLQVKLPPVTYPVLPLKGKGIPLVPCQGHYKRICRLLPIYPVSIAYLQFGMHYSAI